VILHIHYDTNDILLTAQHMKFKNKIEVVKKAIFQMNGFIPAEPNEHSSRILQLLVQTRNEL